MVGENEADADIEDEDIGDVTKIVKNYYDYNGDHYVGVDNDGDGAAGIKRGIPAAPPSPSAPIALTRGHVTPPEEQLP